MTGPSSSRPKASNKEVEGILREAEAQGYVVAQVGRRNVHFRVSRPVVQPDGSTRLEWVCNFPSTPGNNARRSILNSLAPLRRAGFKPRR